MPTIPEADHIIPEATHYDEIVISNGLTVEQLGFLFTCANPTIRTALDEFSQDLQETQVMTPIPNPTGSGIDEVNAVPLKFIPQLIKFLLVRFDRSSRNQRLTDFARRMRDFDPTINFQITFPSGDILTYHHNANGVHGNGDYPASPDMVIRMPPGSGFRYNNHRHHP